MTHRVRLVVVLLIVMLLGLPAAAQPPRLNRKQVEALLQGSRNFYKRDLTGVDLSGLDFRQADLTEAILRRAILTNAVLAGAILERATLTEAQLAGADLTHARLAGANLARANLRGANLQNADLAQADLVLADLRQANLQSAVLTEAKLIGTDLQKAWLVGANLEGAALVRVLLRGADLTRAVLRKARVVDTDFRDVVIQEARFARADLATARNLEEARGAETAIWEEPIQPSPAPDNPVARGPWIARLTLHSGQMIEVESWRLDGEMVFYEKGGITHGVPSIDVGRIEDASGKVLRDTPAPMRNPAACPRPEIGSSEEKVREYFRCLRVVPGFRTITRQGQDVTAYGIPSQAGGRYGDYYVIRDGRLVEIDVGGYRP